MALVSMAVAIVLGAASMSDIALLGPGITQTIAATRAPPESLRLTPGFP